MITENMVRVRRGAAHDAIILATLRYEFRSAIGEPIESLQEFVARCQSWMRERLASDERWCSWIAETVDESGPLAVGAVWLQLIEKIPNPVVEKEMHAYITSLFVLESARNRGAGSLLLDAAIGECVRREVDSIILWPTPRSRSLYERHGFAATNAIMARVL